MASAKILVVEDNPVTRKMLRLALETEGFSVIEAEDAGRALAAVNKGVPDLILQDLLLPDMDGIELVGRFRKIPGFVDVPILALSGFLSKLEDARTIGSGFTAFLVKPIEPSRLLEVVRTFLPAERPRDAEVGRGRRILLAEDDPVQLKLLRLQLVAEGFEVRTAPNGEAALRAAREDPPDAIVSDILMPGLDGFDLCLELRRDMRLILVPVILLSSHYLEEADLELARRVGAARLLVRPADAADLRVAILEAIEVGAPRVHVEAIDGLRGEHAMRVIRQLERQVGLNAGLARRCALQAAELSLLGGVADALAKSGDTDEALRDVLASCLDAAGISRGAIFLGETPASLQLRHMVGYGPSDRENVSGFFGHPEVLARACESGAAFTLPAASVPEDEARELLALAGMSSMLVVPLVSAGQNRGALVLGSYKTDMTAADQVAFGRALAAQIGQALALTTAFGRVAVSERRYRTLMEQSSEGIAIRTEDGVILEVNSALERLLALPRERIVGRHIMDLIDPEDRERMAEANEALRVGGSHRTGDHRVRAGDGRTIILDMSSAIVDTGGGRVVQAVARDMTERRATEDALRASEARFRGLVESMDDVIFTVDAKGRHTGVHGRWHGVFRDTPDAFVGKTTREVLGEELAAPHEEACARALAGQRVVYDWSAGAPGGRRHFQTSLSPVRDAAGKITGLVGVGRETTEQKKLQAQLMVSDRMASVGMMAAGVAHEINNPLAAVLANLHLSIGTMEESCRGLGLEAGLGEALEQLGDARDAADRIREIMRDLKIFSRSEEDRTGPVDLRRVLESSARMAWNEIRHRATLVKTLTAVPLVEGNESRLGQVFLNLLLNAVQAIPEGRAKENQIRIETRVDESGRVEVAIADTGCGMSQDVLGRLFTPFFTTKPQGVGTGLGLSICHRIITGLGGEIRVDSEPGKGSVFRVLLPVTESRPSVEVKAVATAVKPSRRGRILVVDDEPMIARLIRRVLAADHDITDVTRAAEALDQIRRGEQFDVILCDLMMPEMTGMDLHEELLRTAADQANKMIFLTGGAFTPSAREFLERVPNLRIEKPFDNHTLRALVNERLR